MRNGQRSTQANYLRSFEFVKELFLPNGNLITGEAMDKSTLTKLLLSRSLYYMAKENGASTNDIRLTIACNLLQDSVEYCLLAVAEHHNAAIPAKTEFDKYFTAINEKTAPYELPFRSRLISLNKQRVISKHNGLAPSKSEIDSFIILVWEFLTDVSQKTFGKSFATISLLDMMKGGEAIEILRTAEAFYDSRDYTNCLIACRKAIFIKYEANYDAQKYITEGANKLGMIFHNSVPYYARDPKYLADHVKDPTDYVIFDHNQLEMDLIKSRIDSVAFWNVIRLTPDVYRKSKNEEWVLKQEFQKLLEDGLDARAEYVLLATTEIMLAADEHKNRVRSHGYAHFRLTLLKDQVNIYEKASKLSNVICISPVGVNVLVCDFIVGGLEGPEKFWHVSDWTGETNVSGFIHADDVAAQQQ